MLCQKFKDANELNLKTNQKIFPKISDRDFWENAKPDMIAYFEKNVKQYEGVKREHLTATLYRRYEIDGDRMAFQNVYFARRRELVNKVILECFYNDDRYMDDIVDLTWMILEETTWVVPAHNKVYSKGADSLPTVETNYIDLFAAETACTMAFVYQVMGEKLDEISVNITPRIKCRLDAIINVYLEHYDFWWMGYEEGRKVNNWNPWINSNILAVALVMEQDEEKLRKLVYKVMDSLDKYFDPYPFDGGCDEGAAYWNQAGLTMLECLWLLKLVSDGQIDFFKEQKVKNTLEFFMKMYIENGQVVNFADCEYTALVYYSSLYKIAKLTKSEKVISFAKHLFDNVNINGVPENKALPRLSRSMHMSIRMMDIITYSPELAKMGDTEFVADSDYYLESIQVLTSRKKADACEGIFLAAKGGHNKESHNHNDVGSFVLYKNGTKFLVDSGNMTYRKGTFGAMRYTLWTTRSLYHNLPEIDGVEQKAGKEFAAKNVKYENADSKTVFSLDIADAYPTDIIEKWVRTLEYDKSSQSVSVSEDFGLAKECEISLNFLTPHTAVKNGNAVIITAEYGEKLEMCFERNFDFVVEKIEYNDNILIGSWGENLYRIRLGFKGMEDKIKYVIK